MKEGKVLQNDLISRIDEILKLLAAIEPLEGERLETVKQRLLRNLNDLAANTKYDENRLEQELIYYLEKFDITEEKVRLKQHCDYFLQTLNEDNAGKKTGLYRSGNWSRNKYNGFKSQPCSYSAFGCSDER